MPGLNVCKEGTKLLRVVARRVSRKSDLAGREVCMTNLAIVHQVRLLNAFDTKQDEGQDYCIDIP